MLTLMLNLAQLFFNLVNITTRLIVVFFRFAEPFLHLLLFLIHAEELVVIALRRLDDSLYFFFIFLKLIDIHVDPGAALLHGFLLITDLLVNALDTVVLLMEEDVLLVICRRLLTEHFVV